MKMTPSFPSLLDIFQTWTTVAGKVSVPVRLASRPQATVQEGNNSVYGKHTGWYSRKNADTASARGCGKTRESTRCWQRKQWWAVSSWWQYWRYVSPKRWCLLPRQQKGCWGLWDERDRARSHSFCKIACVVRYGTVSVMRCFLMIRAVVLSFPLLSLTGCWWWCQENVRWWSVEEQCWNRGCVRVYAFLQCGWPPFKRATLCFHVPWRTERNRPIMTC